MNPRPGCHFNLATCAAHCHDRLGWMINRLWWRRLKQDPVYIARGAGWGHFGRLVGHDASREMRRSTRPWSLFIDAAQAFPKDRRNGLRPATESSRFAEHPAPKSNGEWTKPGLLCRTETVASWRYCFVRDGTGADVQIAKRFAGRNYLSKLFRPGSPHLRRRAIFIRTDIGRDLFKSCCSSRCRKELNT